MDLDFDPINPYAKADLYWDYLDESSGSSWDNKNGSRPEINIFIFGLEEKVFMPETARRNSRIFNVRVSLTVFVKIRIFLLLNGHFC